MTLNTIEPKKVKPLYKAAEFDGSEESAAEIIKWANDGTFAWSGEHETLVRTDFNGQTKINRGDHIIAKPGDIYEICNSKVFTSEYKEVR